MTVARKVIGNKWQLFGNERGVTCQISLSYALLKSNKNLSFATANDFYTTEKDGVQKLP